MKKYVGGKLTIKQAKLIKGVAEGLTVREATLRSYNVKSPEVADSVGSEALALPKVREALQEALRAQGLTLDVVTSNMRKIAVADVNNPKPETVLKANIEILKLYGAYPDKKTAHLNVSVKSEMKSKDFNALKAEVARMDQDLKELFGDHHATEPIDVKNDQ